MANKRIGRPPVGDKYRQVCMTSQQADDIDLIAAVLGVSQAEVIRRALALGLAQMKRRGAA